MRTYAYLRINPNSNFVSEKYISLLRDLGYSVQKNRLIVEEVLACKSIFYRDKILNLIEYSLEEDDLLIVKSIDCLGRNFDEIIKIINKIYIKKIRIICIDYSKNEISGELKTIFLHFLKISFEFESLFLVNSKMEVVDNMTKKVGRPEVLNNDQKDKVILLYKQGISVYSLAKKFSVTRTVIQRVISNAKSRVI
ncbi:recombinase family protein [Acinetobacter pittii]|uniref:recombinase family protein n=1 Tax=Acinetobacter pittii TaxID=48296 RepID=UPI0019528636|nr:recombinase family protein [Acinetobacter pittii]QRQ11554.1 recombinase family protein [Acinetobacter pittii]